MQKIVKRGLALLLCAVLALGAMSLTPSQAQEAPAPQGQSDYGPLTVYGKAGETTFVPAGYTYVYEEEDGSVYTREAARDMYISQRVLTPQEAEALAGLEGGADDYVVKPFSPRELVARVKAVLNRTMPRSEASDGTMTFGELTIDTASHTVRVAGEDVSLTPKEFDLLVFLASNKGIALSREKILQKVWNYDYFGEDRTVDTHVKMLRGHLGKCRGYIATVWGIGYKFDPDAAR